MQPTLILVQLKVIVPLFDGQRETRNIGPKFKNHKDYLFIIKNMIIQFTSIYYN